jgi:hypothetical protein
MSLRELLLLANDYLAQHRDELIAQTWERVQNAPSLRALYDREQRDRQRTLERQRATRVVQRTPNNQTVPGEPVSKTQ